MIDAFCRTFLDFRTRTGRQQKQNKNDQEKAYWKISAILNA